MPAITMRRAYPDEAEALRALCRRAKQSHGYDDAFMDLLFQTEDFNLVPAAIERNTVMVAEIAGRVVGFAQLRPDERPDTAHLEDLFVEPDAQGMGVGRILFDWAWTEAARRGYAWLEWESDPNAAPFYVKMGGELIGNTESTIKPGRMIPKFRKATARPVAPNPSSAPMQRRIAR